MMNLYKFIISDYGWKDYFPLQLIVFYITLLISCSISYFYAISFNDFFLITGKTFIVNELLVNIFFYFHFLNNLRKS